MSGELAQMVERPLSMREAPGSIPGFSSVLLLLFSNDNNDICYHLNSNFLFNLLVFAVLFCFALFCFDQKPPAEPKHLITLLN